MNGMCVLNAIYLCIGPWSGSLSGGRRLQSNKQLWTNERDLSSSAACFNENYDYVADPWEEVAIGGAKYSANGMGALLTNWNAQKGQAPFDMDDVSSVISAPLPAYP